MGDKKNRSAYITYGLSAARSLSRAYEKAFNNKISDEALDKTVRNNLSMLIEVAEKHYKNRKRLLEKDVERLVRLEKLVLKLQ